jgi:hypothetical protein
MPGYEDFSNIFAFDDLKISSSMVDVLEMG